MRMRYLVVLGSLGERSAGGSFPFETRDEALAWIDVTAKESLEVSGVDPADVYAALIDMDTDRIERLTAAGELR